jgi:hypothetical protein
MQAEDNLLSVNDLSDNIDYFHIIIYLRSGNNTWEMINNISHRSRERHLSFTLVTDSVII